MKVIKSDGEEEVFSKTKLCDSIKKAGAPKHLADTICNLVESKMSPGITTTKIFRSALNYLVKENIDTAANYSLRRGIAALGPAGFIFEQYIEALLQAYGYKTKRNVMMQGKCIPHEVDVLAKKDKDNYIVEAKYHNEHGIKTHVDVIMHADSRWRDISSSNTGITHKMWVITNTKFTSSAVKYGKCQNIILTGWYQSKNQSLESMILKKKLYPITVLPSLTKAAREQFAAKKMVLAQDILLYSPEDLSNQCGLDISKANKILSEAHQLVV